MNRLLYIGRLVMAVGLLLLLAVAPAMAQNVVYVGETIPLAVEQKGLDNYQWHLYSDSTVNFAVAPADVNPPYAEFIGASDLAEVNVLWKIPGTYFFKVTAVDENNCAMNLKIGRMTVKNNPKPILDAIAIDSKCPGEKGRIFFTVTNVAPGNYTVKHDQGGFNVTVVADTFSVEAPAGRYDNLTIEVNGYSSYDASNPVNVEVKQPAPIEIIVESITHINLATNTKGAIKIRVQGGNNSYTYRWSNGETTANISNLEEGEYTVTVKDGNGCEQSKDIKILPPNSAPLAMDDYFQAGCNVIKGDLILNDTDAEDDDLFIGTKAIVLPQHGEVIFISKEGNFEYRADPLFAGKDSFTYALFDKNNYPGVHGKVVLEIFMDSDRDGIYDPPLDDLAKADKDADGDGLLNDLDGYDDFDNDGLPNYLDIDSDGDGILDHYEVQHQGKYVKPSFRDENNNGVDDAYDNFQMTRELTAFDNDGDGMPDYLDLDSDNDGVFDRIEGHDSDKNGRPDNTPLGVDKDNDGLDDGYDSFVMECDNQDNIVRSYAAMWDTDGDGLRDWRDDNDDGDDYPTRLEDLDGDTDYSNDDFDYDGIPEYLDPGRDCDLFIPNAFSPNKDGVYDENGVHDTFMIYCLNHFPNAKIYIFDQSGNKLFEKANYGREDLFGDQAWWDGKADRGRNKGELLPPGTYFYVLDLGNGEVKKSFVFLSY